MSSNPPLDAEEIRQAIRWAATGPDPDSWSDGVTVITRSGERIRSTFACLTDDDIAVLSTSDGERSLAIDEIVNVLMHFRSTGPE